VPVLARGVGQSGCMNHYIFVQKGSVHLGELKIYMVTLTWDCLLSWPIANLMLAEPSRIEPSLGLDPLANQQRTVNRFSAWRARARAQNNQSFNHHLDMTSAR